MLQLKDNSIENQLMAINLLTVSVLMTLLCAGLVFNEYLSFKKSSIESLTIQARMIANNSTAAVSFNDSKAAMVDIFATFRKKLIDFSQYYKILQVESVYSVQGNDNRMQ